MKNTTVLGDVTVDGIITGETTPWINATLQNGWVNYGNEYSPARYRMVDGRYVCIEGLIRSGNMASTAFTLPPEYRPNSRHLCCTISAADASSGLAASTARIDILTNGTVYVANGNNPWFSIFIVYELEQ